MNIDDLNKKIFRFYGKPEKGHFQHTIYCREQAANAF